MHTSNLLLNRIHHVKFGKVLGMQTRKGTAVFLTDILDEAKGRMLHNMQQASSTLSSFYTVEYQEIHVTVYWW